MKINDTQHTTTPSELPTDELLATHAEDEDGALLLAPPEYFRPVQAGVAAFWIDARGIIWDMRCEPLGR